MTHMCMPKIHYFLLSKNHRHKKHIAHSYLPSTPSTYIIFLGTSTKIGVGECFGKE